MSKERFDGLLNEVYQNFFEVGPQSTSAPIETDCSRPLQFMHGDCSDFARMAYSRAHCHGLEGVQVRMFEIPEGRHSAVTWSDGEQTWVGDSWYKRPVPIEQYRKEMKTKGL